MKPVPQPSSWERGDDGVLWHVDPVLYAEVCSALDVFFGVSWQAEDEGTREYGYPGLVRSFDDIDVIFGLETLVYGLKGVLFERFEAIEYCNTSRIGGEL